tara:strand:- start:60 stop:2060 length:2001 start_codon:yes stop_codon:yes gene_type:complete
MAVTGDLAGNPVQLNNAAEEATLQRAVQALEVIASRAGTTIDSKSLSIFQQNLSKASAAASSASTPLYNVGSAANNASSALNRASTGFQQVGSSISGIFSNLESTQETMAGGLRKGIANATQSITRLGAGGSKVAQVALSALAGTAGILGGTFLGQIDTFQKAARAGADLGGSLLNAHRIAQDAGINLTMFTEAVRGSPEAFAGLGATTEQGARAFARLNRGVLRTLTGPMASFGIGTVELTQRTAEAAEQLARAGYTADQLANSEQQVQQIVKQDIQIQRARAKINGTTLEQEREKMKQARTNMTVEMATIGLNKDQRLAAQDAFNAMKDFGPTAQQFTLEMIKFGRPMSASTAAFEMMNKEVAGAGAAMARDITSNEAPDRDQFINAMQRMDQDRLQMERDRNGNLAFLLQATGNSGLAAQATSEAFEGSTRALRGMRQNVMENALADLVATNKKFSENANVAMSEIAVTVQNLNNRLARIGTDMTTANEAVTTATKEVMDTAAETLVAATRGLENVTTTLTQKIMDLIKLLGGTAEPPKGRALGGPVTANTSYLVGETGPELLQMGSVGGNVLPADQTRNFMRNNLDLAQQMQQFGAADTEDAAMEQAGMSQASTGSKVVEFSNADRELLTSMRDATYEVANRVERAGANTVEVLDDVKRNTG